MASPLHPSVIRVAELAAVELERARQHHAPMHSPHEGWAVIKEELDELWKHVLDDTGTGPGALSEALQIAAMGMRYALDLCPELMEGSAQ